MFKNIYIKNLKKILIYFLIKKYKTAVLNVVLMLEWILDHILLLWSATNMNIRDITVKTNA